MGLCYGESMALTICLRYSLIRISMWLGELESGRKVMLLGGLQAGLKGPLQVNSLERKKPKKTRVKAVHSMI